MSRNVYFSDCVDVSGGGVPLLQHLIWDIVETEAVDNDVAQDTNIYNEVHVQGVSKKRENNKAIPKIQNFRIFFSNLSNFKNF